MVTRERKRNYKDDRVNRRQWHSCNLLREPFPESRSRVRQQTSRWPTLSTTRNSKKVPLSPLRHSLVIFPFSIYFAFVLFFFTPKKLKRVLRFPILFFSSSTLCLTPPIKCCLPRSCPVFARVMIHSFSITIFFSFFFFLSSPRASLHHARISWLCSRGYEEEGRTKRLHRKIIEAWRFL